MNNIFDPFIIITLVVPIFITLVVLIFSAILHEIAHGLVADRLGDPTARLLGRLTLDPRPHIDPMLSVIVPLILLLSHSPIIIGAAKPVPVDYFNLKDGRKDMALVSLAGPLTNIVIAVVATLIFTLFFKANYNLYEIIFQKQAITSLMDLLAILFGEIISINVLLGIFNLVPFPPLDGSKIFSLVLPDKTAAAFLSIGQRGIFIIFLVLFLFPGFGNLINILYLFGLSLLGF